MLWNLDEQMFALKTILILLIVFIFLTKQKDEVAISKEYFYHIKRSVLPVFTRVKKYRLEDIISMRCSGVHNDTWELVDLFGAGGNMRGQSNMMEMTFKNGSSTSLDLRIGRDNLNKIVSLAKRLKEPGD